MDKLDVTSALPDFYLPFAAYALQTRAIPDARDGLKTGARFILYSQYLDKLTYDKKKRKAVATVNAAMRFSPHGDASIYGNAIRMSQNFALRYPVIETQGNNGSMLNGDDYSASRYVEMRGGQIASEMTSLLNKETIEKWKLNYTQEEYYPTVLPSKFPFSLVNGSYGIGVSCSSSIPQFNLREVCDALIVLNNNPSATFEELYCPVDFATGGIVINESQVKESLKNGHGKAVAIRAKAHFNEKNREIVITEMPYQCFTSNAIVSIQKAIDNGKLAGVDSVFDGTDLSGVKICVKISKAANPERVMKQLYKETSLQSYYSVNMIMLRDGKVPEMFNWKSAMETYLSHLKNIVRKAYEFDLKKIELRAHILSGYLAAIGTIEEVVSAIKNSSNSADALLNLIERFGFSETQAKAILDLKLQRLVSLEGFKIQKELDEKIMAADEIRKILSNEDNFNKVIEEEILSIKKKYGDNRRTQNMDLVAENTDEPVEQKRLVISLTNTGNLCTMESSTLFTQNRGGKGKQIKLSSAETIVDSISGDNSDTLMLFSNKGKCYSYPLSNIPIGEKTYCSMLFELGAEEQITNIISYEKCKEYAYAFFTTKNGMVKKTLTSKYKTRKTKGISAIKLREGDSVVGIDFVNEDRIGIATQRGKFLMISSTQIAAAERDTMGVKGIELTIDDKVVCSKKIDSSAVALVALTQEGWIKKTDISEFNVGNRATKGALIQKVKSGDFFVGFVPLSAEDKTICVCSEKAIIRFSTVDISLTGRSSAGVKSIDSKEKKVSIFSEK